MNEYCESYNRGIALLFYEIGKTKTELKIKIEYLKSLTQKSFYVGVQHTVANKLGDIEKQLNTFDTSVRLQTNGIKFEECAKQLIEFKLAVYECEAQLFEAIRSNVSCTFCNKD